MSLFGAALATVDEDARRRFESAWRSGKPLPIEQCLPPSDHPLYLSTLEELVHIELEFRWKRPQEAGESPSRVESYLERFPQLQRPEIVQRLLRQEWHVRLAAGDRPTPAEFGARFPGWSETQDDALAIVSAADKSVRPWPQIPGYRILEEIGRGGMGVVYKARHLGLDRLVALKMILHGSHAGAEERERFRAEARAVAQLAHPNIVQIYEVGEHEGEPYIALEFIEGGNLARIVAEKPLEARTAAALAACLAEAVHVVHQCGILHRDLKPANVMLAVPRTPASASGGLLGGLVPKISDFGLAKRWHSEAEQQTGQRPEGITQSGAIVGTPSYMAPEQADGRVRELSRATDVHALGAILYELLTGRPPFRGQTALETLEQVRTQEPAPPRRLQPSVPRDLQTICLKCLRKEPAGRYGSALDLAQDLERFLDHRPIQARPVGLWERLYKKARRRPATTLLVLVALCGVAGLAATYRLWQHQGQAGLTGAETDEVQVEYFANYVKRWGVPEGIGPLTEQDARHGQCSLKFYRRAGKVEKVEAVNGRGFLTTHL